MEHEVGHSGAELQCGVLTGASKQIRQQIHIWHCKFFFFLSLNYILLLQKHKLCNDGLTLDEPKKNNQHRNAYYSYCLWYWVSLGHHHHHQFLEEGSSFIILCMYISLWFMISSPGCASLSKHIEGSLIGADRRDHTCNQMISIEVVDYSLGFELKSSVI